MTHNLAVFFYIPITTRALQTFAYVELPGYGRVLRAYPMVVAGTPLAIVLLLLGFVDLLLFCLAAPAWLFFNTRRLTEAEAQRHYTAPLTASYSAGNRWYWIFSMLMQCAYSIPMLLVADVYIACSLSLLVAAVVESVLYFRQPYEDELDLYGSMASYAMLAILDLCAITFKATVEGRDNKESLSIIIQVVIMLTVLIGTLTPVGLYIWSSCRGRSEELEERKGLLGDEEGGEGSEGEVTPTQQEGEEAGKGKEKRPSRSETKTEQEEPGKEKDQKAVAVRSLVDLLVDYTT